VSAAVEEVNIVVTSPTKLIPCRVRKFAEFLWARRVPGAAGKRIIVLMLAPDQAERAVIFARCTG